MAHCMRANRKREESDLERLLRRVPSAAHPFDGCTEGIHACVAARKNRPRSPTEPTLSRTKCHQSTRSLARVVLRYVRTSCTCDGIRKGRGETCETRKRKRNRHVPPEWEGGDFCSTHDKSIGQQAPCNRKKHHVTPPPMTPTIRTPTKSALGSCVWSPQKRRMTTRRGRAVFLTAKCELVGNAFQGRRHG
jgi:hypothetical protein